MSGKTFDRIKECLKLDHEEEAPEHRDRLFWISTMTKGFNDNVAKEFNPLLFTCADESMVVFNNTCTLG